jgi:hypothetical protein
LLQEKFPEHLQRARGIFVAPGAPFFYSEAMGIAFKRSSKVVAGLLLLYVPAGSYAFGSSVVRLVREPNAVAFSVQKGYGVQRDGKHELVFTSVATGKVLKTVKGFQGNIAAEDKKYFDRLDPVTLPAVKGKIRVTGRIFYCSFEQKFCSVQRVDEEI